MKTFTLDPAYIASVTIYKEWNMYAGNKDSTEEDLVKVLKGEGKCSMTSSADHPEYAALRERLAAEGYIMIERGWWNGDVVTTPFLFNGYRFKKGDQFPSGAAMSGHLKFMKKK